MYILYSVTSLDEFAFKDCTSLENVSISLEHDYITDDYFPPNANIKWIKDFDSFIYKKKKKKKKIKIVYGQNFFFTSLYKIR